MGSGYRGRYPRAQVNGESNTFVDPFSTPYCAGIQFGVQCIIVGSLNGTAVTDYEAKIKWFGTVRGRLGYLITDQLLLYGTGWLGLRWG